MSQSRRQRADAVPPDMHLRVALVQAMQRMQALGLNQGTAGNASVRHGEALLLTPSGVPCDALAPEDIVRMRASGRWRCEVPGRVPTSEWRFHRDILRARPEFGAVVHTHGRAVTTLACLRRDIPAFHYMVAVAGGHDIRCAGYATFGTAALSARVMAALEGRRACLIANHGMVAAGTDLAAALTLAMEVEALADVYWRALQVGEPVLLTPAQMDAVLARFAQGYGRVVEAAAPEG